MGKILFRITVFLLIGAILFLFLRLFLPGGKVQNGDRLLDGLLDFTCKATVSYNGLTAEADVARSPDGTTRITLNTPETLKGLQFDFSNEGASLNFKGLKLDVEAASFLASSMTAVIADAFATTLRDAAFSPTEQGDAFSYTARGNGGSFTLTFDKESGAPLALNVPALDLTCEFSEYRNEAGTN